VERETIEQLAAVLARERIQIDVLVPDREVEPQVVEAAGRRDVIPSTHDLEQPERLQRSPLRSLFRLTRLSLPRIIGGPEACAVTGLARAVTFAARGAWHMAGMSTLLHIALTGMALGRIGIGAAPFIAAGPSSRLLGFPANHDNPTTRLMARMFGVRDIGLGVLVLWGLRHPETLPFIMLFQAATDAGDFLSMLIPLIKRQGIDRAALRSAGIAMSAALLWIAAWLIAR